MREIPLTKGKVALVDDDMYDYLMQWKWCYGSGGYAKRNGPSWILNGKRTRNAIIMHRVILNAPEGMVVDHINHNTLDNRRCNIRICTQSENSKNVSRCKSNTSGYKGVTWLKKNKKWHVRIKVDTQRIHLGLFDSLLQAVQCYNQAALKYHGEFAHLNETPEQ